MLAKPIRFQVVGSELSYQLSSSVCLRRCCTVLVDYMLGQYDFKNVQNLFRLLL